MKKLLFGLFLAIGAAFFITSCKDDGDKVTTLYTTLQDTPELSSLLAAVDRAGLASVLNDPEAELTVFAPTNAAFATLLNGAALESIPVDDLKNILLNHVVSGVVKSTDLTTGYVPSLLTFNNSNIPVNLYVNLANGVVINDATVTTADVEADNGVAHIVNKVIVPPTVVNHALNNPAFSSLVAALTRPDLGVDYVAILSGAGPFTVFAPTNAAFTALLAELGGIGLNDIPAATLNAVLQYHVVNGANVRAASLVDEQVVTTFGGGTFKVDLTTGAQIVDAQARVSNIIITDVQGTNGVVHAIDKVLLP
ncbi:MAG: fasciclin domain-containing protein [Saprospiraceae bacterium]|nr:fasciclin domain-containing protein [Saprospiraceae bacterium]